MWREAASYSVGKDGFSSENRRGRGVKKPGPRSKRWALSAVWVFNDNFKCEPTMLITTVRY